MTDELTVAELIALLKSMPDDAVVKTYDDAYMQLIDEIGGISTVEQINDNAVIIS